MDRLSGRACLITGASRGLGESLARNFWAEGASLFLVARHAVDLDRLVARLGKRPGQKAMAFATDLAEPAGVANIVGLVKANSSRLERPDQQRGDSGACWPTLGKRLERVVENTTDQSRQSRRDVQRGGSVDDRTRRRLHYQYIRRWSHRTAAEFHGLRSGKVRARSV